jgi:mannosyltransferase OCH1-like enzyme
MKKPFLWLYWEQTKDTFKPAYIELCIETIYRHCKDFEIRMTTERTIPGYIDLHPQFYNMSEVAHKADYIRYKLLHKYGGMWLDCDMIVMRDMGEIVNLISEKEFLIHGKDVYSINFLAALPGHEIFKKCIDVIERKLNTKQTFDWTELGSSLISKFVPHHNHHCFDPKLFVPITWKEYTIFNSSDTKKLDFNIDLCYTIAISNKIQHLHNRGMLKLTKKQILESNMLLGYFFRKAFGYGNE